MKKFLKSISAILVSIVYFLCSGIVIHGEDSGVLNDYFQKGEWKYLLTSKNYQYKQLADTIRSSAADQYLLSIIDFYIKTGAEPDKRKYEEVLMNIIMTSEYNSSEKISEQYKMDKMKSGKEYLMDAKEAVNSALTIYSGIHGTNNKWEEALITAIDGLSTFTDNADNWLNALCDLETVLYNYGKCDELLNYIYENSTGELKEAARELNSGMKSLMCIKLEMYNDVSDENFENYTELLFTDSFFAAVKLSDEYANDDSLKFFVDKADDLFEKLDVLDASWNLGTIIGKTIGNITVGGENLIRRVHEIEALSDIEDLLSKKIMEEQNVLINNQTIDNLQKYVYDCNILIGTHIRGEYCVYSIIAKDSGWQSFLNFSKAEDAKQWYDHKVEKILKIEKSVDGLLDINNSGINKSYKWYLEPTIEADNIIVPDYDNELFEKYAIIEKNGKYGLISNKGKFVENIKYNDYLICVTSNSYILGNNTKNGSVNDFSLENSDNVGYKIEDGKLMKTNHGGHGIAQIYYYYNINDNKVYKANSYNQLCEEYKENEVILAQSFSMDLKNNNEAKINNIYDEYYLVNGKGKINDIKYECGNNVCNTSMYNVTFAQKNNKWFYFDNNGNIIISDNVNTPYYSSYGSNHVTNQRANTSFSPFLDVDGVIAVNTNHSGYFYDIIGNQLITFADFEEVRPMINNFAWVKKDGKWGVVEFDIEKDDITKKNENLSEDVILNSINKYLEENWNNEYSYYVMEVYEEEKYWKGDIRWNGGSGANQITGNCFKVNKSTFDVSLYYIDEEDVLTSFNLMDYYNDKSEGESVTEDVIYSQSNKGTVKINDGYLNIRDLPSTYGKVIGKLYNGDQVIIQEINEDGNWYKIIFNDIIGYVSSDYIIS